MKAVHWVQKTHLFRADEFICSACGSVSSKPYKVCPTCGSTRGNSPTIHIFDKRTYWEVAKL